MVCCVFPLRKDEFVSLIFFSLMIPPLLTGSTEPLSSWEPYPNECVLTRYIIDVLFSEKFLTNDFINRCWLLQSICHLREEL